MLYTIEEEKKKSSGRKPGGNRCSIWEIVTPFYFYPLTGIFPFTLVEKHILIQLHKRNTCHYSDTFGAQGAYNRSHDHFFFCWKQTKKKYEPPIDLILFEKQWEVMNSLFLEAGHRTDVVGLKIMNPWSQTLGPFLKTHTPKWLGCAHCQLNTVTECTCRTFVNLPVEVSKLKSKG